MSEDARWERLSAGRVVAVEAESIPEPPPELELTFIAVEAESNERYSVLLDLLDELTLARELSPWHDLSSYVAGGPRRELWGMAERGVEHALVDALNRAYAAGEQVALVIDGAERCDAASLNLILRAANRPGWVKPPLMLVFRSIPDDGPIRNAASALGAEPIAKIKAKPVEVDVPAQHRSLLRAAAWLGSPFLTKELARLVERTPLAVLLALQDAIDLGVPLKDESDGRFSLPDNWTEALGRDLLPALAEAWVAAHLGQSDDDADEPEPTGLRPARRAWLCDRRDDAIAFAERAVDVDDDAEAGAALADLAWFHLQAERPDAALEAADRLVALTSEAASGQPHTNALILRAMVRQALGGEHLEAALADVRAASERATDDIARAALLADEASLAVTRGDVPEAARCLSRARALIKGQTSVAATLLIAETNLLTGRLPLFAEGDPKPAVLASAARHARKAVDAWEPRGRSSDLAIVSRTLGDLERLAGRPSSAMARYSEAVHLQREIGDDVGLAITTQSLAGVLASVGSLNEAVSVLADSVGLNARTGTSTGLDINQQTIEMLRNNSLGNPGVQRALDSLAGRIEDAVERSRRR